MSVEPPFDPFGEPVPVPRGRVGEPHVCVDDEGVRWTVSEHDGRHVPGANGARCLVFASLYAFRRVWDYPPDWRTLPHAALIDLSWRR